MAYSGQVKLKDALGAFSAILDPADKSTLLKSGSLGDPEAFLQYAVKQQQANSKRAQKYAKRFMPFLTSVQQFSSIIETCVQAGPDASNLIWGAVKLVILVVFNFFDYLEKMAEMFARLGEICPQFQRVQVLFPQSPELQDSISAFYATTIRFCHDALVFLRAPGHKKFVRTLWKPFKERFQAVESALDLQKEIVDREITLASQNAAFKERRAFCLFRSQAIQHQVFDLQQWENSREWRLRQDLKEKQLQWGLLLAKISSYDHTTDFTDHFEKRSKNTGQWFFQNANFRKWIATSSAGLWCHGIAGCGKSVLCSSVIDYVYKDALGPESYLCYFFCTFDKHESLQPKTILESLIKQILFTHGKIPSDLQKHVHSLYNGPVKPDFKSICDLYTKLSQWPRTLYLILDGLDECTDQSRKTLVLFFKKLLVRAQNDIKLLISTRSEVDIEQVLETFSEVNLGSEGNDADIHQFVEEEVERRIELGEFRNMSRDLVDDIKVTLRHGAKGMFLWVTFQIDDICREGNNESEIRKLLQSLPRGLNETYERILSRIYKERKPVEAKKIFMWIACSERPLGLDELVEAVALDSGDLDWHQMSLRFPIDTNKMLQNCGILITRTADQTVRFAHHTILEYLTSRDLQETTHWAAIDISEANRTTARSCLTYLNFTDFQTQIIEHVKKDPIKPSSDTFLEMTTSSWLPVILGSSSRMGWIWRALIPEMLDTGLKAPVDVRRMVLPSSKTNIPAGVPSEIPMPLREKYQLLEYVAKNWLSHCAKLRDQDVETQRVLESSLFCKKYPFQHLPWQTKERQSSSIYVDATFWSIESNNLPVLALALKLQSKDSMATILKDDLGTSCRSKIFLLAALQYACWLGRERHVDVLLKIGAAINPRVGEAFPRRIAGVDMDTIGPPLHAAVYSGNGIIVKKILKTGAALNAIWEDRAMSPLSVAAAYGHLEVVKILLQAGATNSWAGATVKAGPVYLAASKGAANVVKVLLEAGSNFRRPPELGLALYVACVQGHLEVVDLLLVSGVSIFEDAPLVDLSRVGGIDPLDPDILSHQQIEMKSPLYAAAREGHALVVKRLLRRYQPQKVEIVMLIAVKNRHLGALKVLLDEGAKPSDDVLRYAVKGGDGVCFQLLVSYTRQGNIKTSEPALAVSSSKANPLSNAAPV